MPVFDSPTQLFIAAEVAVLLGGVVLLYRFLSGRIGSRQPALAHWPITLEGFVMSFLLVAAGGLLVPHGVARLDNDVLGPAANDGDWWMAVQGAAFQLGLLSGALVSGIILRWSRSVAIAEVAPPPANPTRHPLLAGVVTFLIALPMIGGIGYGWKTFLQTIGYPPAEQDMVDLFRKADDPGLLLVMIFLAVVIAPMTEEFIFRAGVFRYLRTRIPRWLALMIPALLFAILHGNLMAFVPLFALGVFFALAYEYTGRIAVPMIAHSLFNLHTIILVMAGISD